MRRTMFIATARNKNGRSFHSTFDHSITGLLENLAKDGKINTIQEEFCIVINPHTTGENEECDMCHLDLDLCNCKLIEPDPPTHLRLVPAIAQ